MKETVKYRFKVDKDLCIPAMACIIAEPEIYQLDPEGKAEVKDKITLEGLRNQAKVNEWVVVESSIEVYNRILESAKVCPVLAIIVEKEENGKWVRVYPTEY